MSIDQKTLASDIVDAVGGVGNVTSVVHCATRLRFRLKDRALADSPRIESLPGVITVVERGGQFQVVIGNAVSKVYAALPASLTDDDAASQDTGGARANILGRLIDIVSSIFAPVLGVLAATGILKGLLIIASTTGILSSQSTTYQVLYAAADAFFAFLPMMLAVTAARKFGGNIFTAMTIAGAMLYTTLVNVNWMIDGALTPMTLLEYMRAGNLVDFLGIPVLLQVYTSSVLPIIAAVWVQSHLERWVDRWIHEAVRTFITPLIVLVLIVPVTLLTLGPAGVWVSNLMAGVMTSAYEFSPILLGLLMGGLWQVLVIFGVHWGIVPLFINNIATQGFDYVKSAAFPAVLAQAGAALGVMLRTRNAKTRALSASATLAAVFGITEPAIYGVTLPRKRTFVIACISGAIGGAIVGIGGVRMFSTGAPGLLTLPIGIDPSGDPANFLWLLAGTAVAFVLSAVGTYFFGFSPADRAKDAATDVPAATTAATSATSGQFELVAPASGSVVPLGRVDDDAFSSGSMGPGFAVVPTDGDVVAPVAGTVVAAQPHAYGIRTDDGIEVLVHIGIDSVTLGSAPFHPIAEVGQKIAAGTPLTTVDVDALLAAGVDPTVVVVIVQGSPDWMEPEPGTVTAGEAIAATREDA